MRGRPSPRIARETVQHVRRPNPKRSASHLDFIRSMPCCVCGHSPRSEAAHVRAGTDGGLGVKPSDRFTVPLCHDHHRIQHTIGELAFWSQRGVDPTALAEHLWTKSGDLDAGTRAVLRTAMQITTKRMAP